MLQRQQVESSKTSTTGQNKEDLSLDLEYFAIRRQILNSNFFQFASKHIRIRLQSWVLKLDSIIINSIWKRNRNNYAKLINLACGCEVVVEPFNSLPYQGDLPKLSKHKINFIIDAIERAVKNETRLTKHSTSSSKNKEFEMQQSSTNKNSLQHEDGEWSSFKEEESSSFMNGRFGNTAELNHEQISFDVKNKQFLSVADQMKFSNQSKKTYFLNKEQKENHDVELKNAQTKEGKICPKHIVVKLNFPIQKNKQRQNFNEGSIKYTKNQSNSSASPYNMVEGDQNSSQGFSDGNQLQNYTLNTEIFDKELSLQHQNQEDQFDFSGEISERCKNKDQILKRDYFAWKQRPDQVPSTEKKVSSFGKNNMRFTESIPAKVIQSQAPSINASIYVESNKDFSIENAEISNQIDDLEEEQGNNLKNRDYFVDITENFNNLN